MNLTIADLAQMFFFSSIIMAFLGSVGTKIWGDEPPRDLNSALMFLSQAGGAALVYALH